MNTKTFAQLARKILIKGVRDKLRFWGFESKGPVADEPQPVSGGYMFRGQVFDDPSVPTLWQSLRRAVQHKGLDGVAEEAAYTWFNRIMAIQILAKNGYELAQLEFAEGAGRLPLILQRAQRGTCPFLNNTEKTRLQKVVANHARETETFAILLIGYCHSHTLLRTVFGSLDDYTELLLPDDILAEEGFLNLLNTTDAISDNEYRKVELIGWLYQFYISEKKDEVFAGFKKNKKAEAEDIPAATQIFTPNWIVKYMVQNTVGKIWLDLHPDSALKANMKYLVEGDNPEYGNPIVSEVSQIKLLDPAVGSGHILVEGFDLLYDIYLAEYYPPEEAVESILRNNLFGLDIDKRAAQLAQFALLLKAAARHPGILKKGIRPNIYAMPEPRPFSRQEVLDFLGQGGLAYADKLFDALHLMQQAQNLGSIMQFELPEAAVDYIARRWQHFQEAEDLNFHEKTLAPAMGAYLPVLLILCWKFEAVAANPPYMGNKKMNGLLKFYIDEHYYKGRFDLMTCFIEVCLNLCKPNGLVGMINIPTWMSISSFQDLRVHIIQNSTIISLLHFGRGVFGADFGAVSFVLKKQLHSDKKGVYRRLFKKHVLVELPEVKEKRFFDSKFGLFIVNQSEFTKLPNKIIAYWVSSAIMNSFKLGKSLKKVALPKQGLASADNVTFLKYWYEPSINKSDFNHKDRNSALESKKKWFPHSKGGPFRRWYGNNDYVINWENDGEEIKSFSKSVIRNPDSYFKPGLTWTDVSSGKFSIRYLPNGSIFDSAGPTLFPVSKNDFPFFLALLNTKVSQSILDIITPTIHYSNGVIGSFPVLRNETENHSISDIAEKCLLISKKDWDSHETSWDFPHSPLLNHQPNLRKACETWQAKATRDFFQLHANEEELNRIFIDIYGLQDELTPEVPLKDITILQDELSGKDLEALEPRFRAQGAAAVALPIQRDVVMQQFVSWLVGLCMGRYRLDKPGLHIAHPAPTPEEIAPYRYNGHSVDIDEDAILPLMGAECAFSDDALQRIKHLLDVIWGADTRTDNLNFLQECLDSDLEKYLVKQFWKDHCRRYKKKPIYWLFSSPGGAFQVLVYMHRMNAFTVERIRDKYLLPHIQHLRSQVQQMESRVAQLSSQEARQLDGLRKDIADCEAYELQLKDVADRQIVFDLDDGVTVNYALFEGVVAPIK